MLLLQMGLLLHVQLLQYWHRIALALTRPPSLTIMRHPPSPASAAPSTSSGQGSTNIMQAAESTCKHPAHGADAALGHDIQDHRQLVTCFMAWPGPAYPSLPTPALPCPSLSHHVPVCQSLLEAAGACPSLPKPAQACPSLPKPAQPVLPCPSLLQRVPACPGLPKAAVACQSLPKPVQACLVLPCPVLACPSLSQHVSACPECLPLVTSSCEPSCAPAQIPGWLPGAPALPPSTPLSDTRCKQEAVSQGQVGSGQRCVAC